MISSGNLVSKRTLGSNAFNSTAFVDGSGTANDVVMWSDSNTLTDAPIAISGNNATFAGSVTINNNTPLIVNGTDPLISFQNSATNHWQVGLENTNSDRFVFYDNNAAAYQLILESTSGNATFAGDVSLGDSKKLFIGTGNDIQISHDASDSYINNLTGDLTIKNLADDKDIIFQSDDGSGGTTTYFRLDGSTEQNVVSKNMRFEDSIQCQFGAGSDLRIYHNGSNSFIQDTGTGGLVISTSLLEVYNAAVDEFMIVGTENGAVDLYHNGSKKFETTSTGAKVTGSNFNVFAASGATKLEFGQTNGNWKLEAGNGGNNTLIIGSVSNSTNNITLDTTNGGSATFAGNVSLADSKKVIFGAGTDLQIYSDGTVGNIKGDDVRLVNASGENIFRVNGDAAELYYNDSKRFETTSTGVTVTGVAVADGLDLGDNEKIRLGASQDLEIYHDGSNSILDNNTGDLIIRCDSDDIKILAEDDILLRDNDDSTNFIHCINGGSVDLYHNGSKKLETTSTGVSVTGTKLSLEDSTADAAVQISFKNDAREWRTGVHGGINDSYTLYDNTAASTRLVVNSSGNVGISTTSPSQPFHCNGNALIAKLGIQSFNASFDLYNNGTTYLNGAVTTGANLTVTGALSKGSGSFKIEHPVKPDTHYLYHSFVESPLTDLIYRGKAKLVDGKALINIDEHFGMTSGTFEALVDDKQVFTTNEDSWDLVKGKVKGNELNIECQNKDFNGYISWLVIGDRKDKHIMEVDWTDERGKPKLEIKK